MSVVEMLARVRDAGRDDVALSAVSATELEHGVWRARNPRQAARRRHFVDDLLSAVPVYPITTEIARRAGKIDALSKQKGIVIPFQDLLIGATALNLGYAVVTGDFRHFHLSPGLEVRRM